MPTLARPAAQSAGLLLLFLAASAANAQTPRRIAGPIDPSRPVALAQKPNARWKAARDLGPLDPETRISYLRLIIRPADAQAAALEQLLEAQRDPSSPDYQRWLTPEEFADRFAASAEDLATVARWLADEGFTVEQTARARNWIAFTGTAAQVSKTFRAPLRRVEWQGQTHFANSEPPSVPAALAGFVAELRGLDDFRIPPPVHLQPAWTLGSAHYLAPDDLAVIYDIAPLYKAGYDGTGQKIVIVGQTDVSLSDIRGFRAQFGLAANDPQLVLYGPDPGVSMGDQVESDLDLEWSGAVARNATIVFVYSRDVMESVAWAIDQNLAPVISMSYGSCELAGVSSSERTLAQQANAEGITWMNSSGDSGAAGCDWGGPSVAEYGPVVTYPADIPEITAVGGTEFNESGSAGWSSTNTPTWQSATGYLPEKAWNDTPAGNGIWASGGGKSSVFAKPSWQAGPGVPADNARDVPDISLTASGDHDGYVIDFGGGLYPIGGTSASSPAFAGIVALLNQYLVAAGVRAKPGLGNINPTLYNLAQNTPGVFHDITAGDNIVPCVASTSGCSTGSFGYNAGVGYDLATGLGSVDAYNLVTKWAGAPGIVATTMKLTANPSSIAASASTQLTATVTPATGTTAPAGSVTFTLGNTSLGSAPLTASSGASSATLTVKASSLVGGANTISAAYSGAGSFGPSNASVAVTVTNAPVPTSVSMAASPSTLPSNATLLLSASVTPASGSAAPTGALTFLLGSTNLGMATLSSQGTASLTLAASKLSMGSNSITASYAGSANFSPSVSAPVAVTVTAPLAPSTTTLAASATTVASTGAVTLAATVKASSGAAVPAGTVMFLAGSTSLGSSTLSSAGTASLSLQASKLSIGANNITASYGGSVAFAQSISAAVAVTVTAPGTPTSTTVSANPPSIASGASTVLTVSVKASTGSTSPTGTVTFTLAGASVSAPALGAAALSGSGVTATASFTLKASSLATGANTICVTYAGDSKMAPSNGQVTVTLTAPAVATTTAVTANPSSILSTASTTLTATVRASSGTATPPGSVTFTAGSTTLGTAALSSSGTAALAVAGSKLAAGSNTITAAYAGATGFAASSGTVAVAVTAPAVATTTTVAASPSSIASTASTTLTATVRSSSGSAAPTGTVAFSLGAAALGSATLSSTGTATLTVKGTSLAAGNNTVTASYAGASGFAASSGTVTVAVTGATGSSVTATAVKGAPVSSPGFPVKLQLQETAGAATTITGLTINGTSFSSVLSAMFGSTTLQARGTLTANIVVQWSPLPATLAFVFTGADASGRTWSQTVNLATK